MKIFFSGIGGAGLGPLAHLALDCGYDVVGSDLASSLLTQELQKDGIRFSLDQSGDFLSYEHSQKPVDLYVFSSAVKQENPEYQTALRLGIPTTKRAGLINRILSEKQLKLLAVAGTHGKTTTTAMAVWMFKQFGIPVSYSIGSTVSFGASAQYVEMSEWFVYECDEFDRNFLDFYPDVSVITSLDYDHTDTYATQQDYIGAFKQFITQSSMCYIWEESNQLLQLTSGNSLSILDSNNIVSNDQLLGEHNRKNAAIIKKALAQALTVPEQELYITNFPGADRRFEQIADGIYTDYAHHPTEIAATIQLSREVNPQVVIVYQPHQNIRQHEVKSLYAQCFAGAQKIYWLPTYLSREDNQKILTAQELSNYVQSTPVVISDLNDELKQNLLKDLESGSIVVAMGAGSIDQWMREF